MSTAHCLMTRLNQEWETVHADAIHDYGSLGTATADEMLTRVRSLKHGSAEQDAALYELLTLAWRRHSPAERLLVQLLIPVAQRMAHRVARLGDLDRVDRVGYAIGTAWEVIGAYKPRLRRRVHANLTMTLLGFLSPDQTANDRVVHDNTFAVQDDVLADAAGEWEATDDPAEVRLARLFTWATDRGVLATEDVALLSLVSLSGRSHGDIADELTISVDCLRKRVHRIRERLSNAVSGIDIDVHPVDLQAR